MNQETNEPVAWMSNGTEFYVQKNYCPDFIPLYTHPAKEHDLGISHAIGFDDGFKAGMQRAVEMNVAKTLTDKEIEELAIKHLETAGSHVIGIYDFAKAILRKAQEK